MYVSVSIYLAYINLVDSVVIVQLLGSSVMILAIALAIYLFTVYGWPVGLFVLIVGLLTVAACAIPLLTIIVPSTAHRAHA